MAGIGCIEQSAPQTVKPQVYYTLYGVTLHEL